jgi:cytochrome c oxidase assembly protein subunit 15
LLAALQGVMGWYMVQSGLAGRTSVSPYRLVAHLSLALVVFAIAVWTAAALSRDVDRRLHARPEERASRRTQAAITGLAAMAFLTILSGGFVAGLDAGRIFNTFPLMEGHVVPPGYWAIDGWRNAFENPIAVQLHHRLLALMTALLVWSAWFWSTRRTCPLSVRRWIGLAALAALVQVSLGIATLLLAVPVFIAVVHQIGAVALLTTLLVGAAAAFDATIRVAEELPA